MDKELFTELSENIFKVNVNLLVERFFIEIANKSHLVSYIKANYTEINIENVIQKTEIKNLNETINISFLTYLFFA